MGTNITRQEAANLKAFATDFRGDNAPHYGTPLSDVIAGAGWSWLEAGVLAGHVPHFEGITLAVRATHMFWMREAAEAERGGVDGDALRWTRGADAYRDLIAVLEGCVAELERASARILTKPLRAECGDAVEREALAGFDASEAAQAEWRAWRAEDRRREASADTARAKAAREELPRWEAKAGVPDGARTVPSAEGSGGSDGAGEEPVQLFDPARPRRRPPRSRPKGA